MVKKSLNTIKELSQSDLSLEIIDYEKEIKKLNYELNNYVETIFGISSEKSEEYKQYLISVWIDHDKLLEQATAAILTH